MLRRGIKMNKVGYKVKIFSSKHIIAIGYIVTFIIFTAMSQYFLTARNISNIIHYSIVAGISVAGISLVLLIGEIDISLGAMISLASIVMAQLLNITDSLAIALVATCICGLLMGAINGLLVSYFSLNSLFATFATMGIFVGIANFIVDINSVTLFNNEISDIINTRVGGIVPLTSVFMVIIFLVIWFIIKFSIYGRKLCAVGSNKFACYLSGIDVRKMRFSAFVLCGLLSSIAGGIRTFQTGFGYISFGIEEVLTIVTATILAGSTIRGGKIYVWRSFLAVIFLFTLDNGMILLDIHTYMASFVKGIVLITVLLIKTMAKTE